MLAPTGLEAAGAEEVVAAVDPPVDDVAGEAADPDGVVAAAPVAAESAPSSGIRPLKSGRPSGAVAVSTILAGASPSARQSAIASPGVGSHANVMRVRPSCARAVPTQNRAGRPRDGSAIELSAAVTAVGASGLGGAVARATSSVVYAQYPFRARTSTPFRVTRTLISWNLPSVGACVEL